MKILHTSDWHLGHSLYGYERTEEHSAVLDSIIQIAAQHQPDLILVSGDIFDTAHPGAAVQKIMVEKVDALAEVCPDSSIIITAGNHDSASRHEAFSALWKRRGVHVIGTGPESEVPDKLIITIPDVGTVLACPFLHPRFIPEDFYRVQLNRALECTPAELPVVMMAHVSVSGCMTVGQNFSVGNIDTVPLEMMGKGYDYLALGHIHRPQMVGDEGRARYCGTPLGISFDEPEQHGVSLVEIKKRGDIPVITHIPIDQPLELITIPAEGAARADVAISLLNDFPPEKAAYIRLNVCGSGPIPPTLNEQARAVCATKAARFCVVNYTNSAETGPIHSLSVEEFRSTSPVEIARNFFSASGIEFDTELEQLMNEAIARVQEEIAQ